MAKFRSIEEAKRVEIPGFPLYFAEEYLALTLTFKNKSEHNNEKIRQLYAFTDKLTAFVSPYMVCEIGCAHCCKRNGVHVWTVEALYIQSHLNIELNCTDRSLCGQTGIEKPCPFLNNNTHTCNIYAYRPYKCRTAFTLDNPIFCESDAVHTLYTSKSNRMLTELLNMIDQINEKHPVRDIRDFFSSP